MNDDDRQIGDTDLTGMTGGDQVRARALRKTLQKLAGSQQAGGPLQEMAREVLAGRVGLREALRVGAYAEALGEKVAEGRRAYEQQSPEERRSQEEAARAYLAEQREEIEQEQRDGGRQGGARPRHRG